MSTQLNATITHRKEINHGLLVLQVTPDGGVPSFRAGQYAVLGLPQSVPRVPFADPEPASADDPEKLIRRAYSISSSSQEGKFLEFYVALVHSGALTPRIFALAEGDRIFLGKKVVGMFTLDEVSPENDVMFVATGTGLAPYVSMLRSSFRFQQRRTIVIHGARMSWDLGYRNMLEALAAQWDNFHYLPVIDDLGRDPGWKGSVGYVTQFFGDGTVDRLLGRPFSPTRMSVFLCGNPQMVMGMQELLAAKGLTPHSRKRPGNIFVEEYWRD